SHAAIHSLALHDALPICRPMNVDFDQRRGTRILFLTMALSVALPCLAQTPEPFEVRRAEAVFEELPVLNASEILRPEILAGSHRSEEHTSELQSRSHIVC